MQISTQNDWFMAIEQGDWATVEISAERFQGSRNSMHETGLMCAARRNYLDIVQVLLKYEAKLRDHNGYTALMFACENNAVDAARLLVPMEGYIFLFDGRTALHIACEASANQCVEILAKNLGSVRDKRGRTSLFSAAEVGNTTAISILLLAAKFSEDEIQEAKNKLLSLGINWDGLFFDEDPTPEMPAIKASAEGKYGQQQSILVGMDKAGAQLHDQSGPSVTDNTPEPLDLVTQLKQELKRKNAVIECLNTEVENLKAKLNTAQALLQQRNAELATQNIAGDISNTMSFYRFVSLTPDNMRIGVGSDLANILVAVPASSLPEKVATTDVMWVQDVQRIMNTKAKELAMLYDVITILSGFFLDLDEPLANELLLLCHTARTSSVTNPLYNGNIRLDNALHCRPDTAEAANIDATLPRPMIKALKEKVKAIGKLGGILTARIQTCIQQEKELTEKTEYLEEERGNLLERIIQMRSQMADMGSQMRDCTSINEAVQTMAEDALLDSVKALLSDHKVIVPFKDWSGTQLEVPNQLLNTGSVNANLSGADTSLSTATFFTGEPGMTSFSTSYNIAARQALQKNCASYIASLEGNLANAVIQLARANQKLHLNDTPGGLSILTMDSTASHAPARLARVSVTERALSPVAAFEHHSLMLENKRLNCIIEELKKSINETPLDANETEEEFFEHRLKRLVSVPQSQVTGRGITVGPQTIDYLRKKLLADMSFSNRNHSYGKRTAAVPVPFIGSGEPETARLHRSYSKLTKDLDTLVEDWTSKNMSAIEVSAMAELAHKSNLHLTAPQGPAQGDGDSDLLLASVIGAENDAPDKRSTGLTPLMVAVYSKSVPDVKAHMSYAGHARMDGTTALMIAAELGFVDAIRLLKDAEERFIRDDGKTALSIATECGNVEAAAILSQKSAKSTLPDDDSNHYEGLELHNAVINSDIEGVRRLAMQFAKSRDHKGRTALMIAATTGYCEAIDVLIQLEGGLHDFSGTTALMLAAEQGNLDCVRLLSPREKDMRDNQGYDALFYMARSKVCIPPEILQKMQEYLL